MSGSILTTKFYIPAPTLNNVPRPRLLQRLNEGLSRKVTLLSAPAGFGKTTLVSQWLHQLKAEAKKGKAEKESFQPSSLTPQPAKVAWLSLDEGDNDPTRFWNCFITAFQQSQPEVGQTALSLLQFAQLPAFEGLLTTLINDLATTPTQFIAVLDDYQLIEAQSIHQALTFLVDHLPLQLHLILITRANPPLPLARLRSQGQLIELRAGELRFTPEEAATFLRQVTGLTLSPENLARLAARTEGWVAGLQLAALSLQEASDISGFIEAFAGDDRYIVDYLVEEVLARRSEEARNFLLQTSILDRMTGSLCAAVTGGVESQRLLEEFEQANLFLIPLDNKRSWYRYHHLFADVLRHRLAQAHGQLLPELHRRAGGWFEQNGLIAEAIHHHLAAKDFERAADLIEQHGQLLIMQGQKETLQRWLRTLPADLSQSRARFSLFRAWMGLLTLPMLEVEPFLQQAEAILRDETSQVGRQGLLSEIVAVRAIVAGVYGRIEDSLQLSQEALAQLPEDNLFLRSTIAYNLGMTYRACGEIRLTAQTFNQAIITGQAGHNLVIALIASYELAKIQMEQGRLAQALETLRQAETFARNSAGPGKPILDSVYVGMGLLYYEWNDLEMALQRLIEGTELAQQRDNGDIILDGQLAIARCYQAQGEKNKAQAALQRAAQVAQSSPRPHFASLVAAAQARLWLALGQQAEARYWLENSGLSTDEELSYSREVEFITLARVLIAQDKVEAEPLTSFLARLQQAAEAGGRTGRVIEILILQALASGQLGRKGQALAALSQALTLAEPEGYIRSFADEGLPLAELLHEARRNGLTSSYVDKLLAAFPLLRLEAGVQPESGAQRANLIEPLSERELEVLRLVAAYASNKEIAERLVITEGTVKNHMSNILGKLGVRNRMQAIDKVKELGLI